MKFTLVTAISLWLANSPLSAAINGPRLHRYQEMAEMGLLPDGTPMQQEDQPMLLKTLYQAPPPPPPDEIVPEYVSLPLDNFAKNGDYAYYGTFNNRYWVNSAYYKPGAPVFLYDAGEADAAPNAVFRLVNETSFFKMLIEKYNAIGIVWEHRYYGNSTPEPIDIYTPPESFRWLTTEQALADVDRFAWQFSRKNISNDLTPASTPWVFVGGSYPGMRAAFMRDKYPETIFASYASSAPTQAQNDMSFYFDPIWEGLNRYGFGNCSRDIKAAVRYIDTILDDHNPQKAVALKEKFLGKGAGKNSHATFADALTSITWLWQSYGVDGGEWGLRQFCDWIETDPKTNKTAPREGWAERKGVQWTVDRWAAWPEYIPMVNEFLTTHCSKNGTAGECNLDLRFTDPAMVAWTWQYCTEWGFLQFANVGPQQLLSKYNSYQHQIDICHRQFPTAKPPLFPAVPDTRTTNAKFGGWNLRPSNTFWSGGEFDPWRTLSPLSEEDHAPEPRITEEVPKCGESTGRGKIFGMVLKNAQHCYDFRTTFKPGEKARNLFSKGLDQWLKCYKPTKNPGKGKGDKNKDKDKGKPGKPWKA